MSEMKSVKTLKKQLMAAIAMVMVAAVALASSTYAWFVNNAQVTATNVDVTATTAYSLQIKHLADGTYGTTTDLNGAVTLKPVSTVGSLVTTAKALTAAVPDGAAAVGIGDGTTTVVNDLQFFTSDAWNNAGVVSGFKEVSSASTHVVTPAAGETPEVTSKYFYKDTVYLKAGQASKIYLDNTTTGIKVGDTVTKFDAVTTAADKALLETMRVGFVVTQGNTRTVYVYQLNATSSGDGFAYNTTINTANGLTAATDSESSTATITTATVKNYNTGIVALTDAVMATGSQTAFAVAPTDANAANNTLATVAANEEVQVDVYMWMEGCDYDTTAANSAQFATTINDIQFGFCIGSAA